MSDLTTLIPNLHEVIGEYTKLENQIEQDSYVATGQVEDRDGENEKQQQTVEESRKRKRGADEVGAEQRKDKAKNFISEKATALMERSLKNRGFIAERGFKGVISPFAEMLEKRGLQSIAKGNLTEEAKVWFYFIYSVLMPSKNLSTVRREEAFLLYALLKGYKINVGNIIERSILGYFERNCRGKIPHPEIITKLCIQGRIEEEWRIEETYPRASPLTFTFITKGPKNRGKGQEKETEEEKRNEG